MQAKIQKWGNSLGLRLPKSVAQEVHISEGSEVEITIKGTNIIIKVLSQKTYKLDELLKDYPKKEKKSVKEVDWGKKKAREEW